jgi:hypothetical protein
MMLDGLHAVLLLGMFLGPQLTNASVVAWLAGHCSVEMLVRLLQAPDEDALWKDGAAVRRRVAAAACLGVTGFFAATVANKAHHYLVALVMRVAYHAVVWAMVAEALQEVPRLMPGGGWSSHLTFAVAAVLELSPAAPEGADPRVLLELARRALDAPDGAMRAAQAALGGPVAAVGLLMLLRAGPEMGIAMHGLLVATLVGFAAQSGGSPVALVALASPWAARLAGARRPREWALLGTATLLLLAARGRLTERIWTSPLLGSAFASFAWAVCGLR